MKCSREFIGTVLFLQWLKDEFLPYLDKWEKDVQERTGFTPAEKKRMLISHETLLGLRMTSKDTTIVM